MPSVLALVPDLMFGSRLTAALTGAGHEVELVPDEARLRERLALRAPDVLVLDMADTALEADATAAALREEGLLAGTRTLAFYSHVDAEARGRAQAARIDVVVPRSRMAREAPELVASLLGAGS